MTTLRVLSVEDSESDAALLRRHLTRAGYELTFERVETAEAMRAALGGPEWDVILADYMMPQFGAIQALRVLQESGYDIPFLVISGTVGEEVAVEAMRLGAHDYLMKDNLTRLAAAIERETEEAKTRRAHRQAEEDLRRSEARYRRLLDTAYEGIWLLDAQIRVTYVNQRLAEMLGHTVTELLGRSALEFVPLANQAQVKERWQRRLEGAQEQYDTVFRRRDGSDLWAIVSAAPIRDEAGEVTGTLALLTDITDRKNAEEALRQSEERYRRLFNNTPQPMWVFDHDTLFFLEVNQAAITHYGYSRGEFLAMKVTDICAASDPASVLQTLIQSNTGDSNQTVTSQHRTKAGKMVEVNVISHQVAFFGRPAQLILAEDITERRVLEDQLRQAQKMEAIGRLAGGVAHDFNNLLTAITGYADLSLALLKETDPLQRNLTAIKIAADHAASLTRQLLAFSRKQILQPEIIDLNHTVRDVEKILKRLIGEDILLLTKTALGLGKIKADPGQIEQVILNLAINARDAMPGGGRLTIETANVILDREYANQHIGVVPGPYVMLAISDNGCGIGAEVLPHIFEPFFTTKDVGKGTGLGLSTVYGIINQSGGNIWVYSELEQGTTFKIYLPRIEEHAEKSPGEAGVMEMPSGNEAILVVEDDRTVRRLVCEVLAMGGYEVLESNNIREAIQICEQYAEPIHLLLSDVVMPEMSGRDLARHLLALRPNMQVLFMSGYTDDAIVHHGILDEDTNFIQKPFSYSDLLEKVRRVLDAAQH